MSTCRGHGTNRNRHWREALAKATATVLRARRNPIHLIAWRYRCYRAQNRRRAYERGEF